MKYLIVVAHPDDEVLGAGASIYKWTRQGDKVDVCIMSTEAKARAFRPEDNELEDDTHAALAYIGVGKEYEGTFPNIEMNTVPHLKLVQHIESAIKESEPDIIITHHPADTNNDHLQTSMACQEAIRLFQRRPEVKPIQEFWYMEVPMGMYRGVMRPYPHPRSAEYISGLAAVRGSQWGVMYAEGFEVVLRAY